MKSFKLSLMSVAVLGIAAMPTLSNAKEIIYCPYPQAIQYKEQRRAKSDMWLMHGFSQFESKTYHFNGTLKKLSKVFPRANHTPKPTATLKTGSSDRRGNKKFILNCKYTLFNKEYSEQKPPILTFDIHMIRAFKACKVVNGHHFECD